MDNEQEKTEEMAKHTRFRAYQLGNAGASYSYYCGSYFTLVEARLTEYNKGSIAEEMNIVGKKIIDTLHITSWDQDHCSLEQLQEICDLYKPNKIEHPGYIPHTQNGCDCLAFITSYGEQIGAEKIISVDPKYISSLKTARDLTYKDIFYGPREISKNSNDNSLIKMFRMGSFSVLSLGDVEDSNIALGIARSKIVQQETDVLILPHHGANNGFLNKNFLKKIKPKLSICCVDFNNQFDHPKQEVRDLLREQNISVFTTKTGDVLIESSGEKSRRFKVKNLNKNNTDISSEKMYSTKRGSLFSMNFDSLKNLRRGNHRY